MAEEALEDTSTFARSERAIYTELYFPKRIDYEAPIADVLAASLKEREVKNYLRGNLRELLRELRRYPELFDPRQYTRTALRAAPITEFQAMRRIAQFRLPVEGWARYPVEGVFRSRRGRRRIYEELTQTVRIIFRLNSRYRRVADDVSCLDALRLMFAWLINDNMRLDEQRAWDPEEKERFLARHNPWPDYKRTFVEEYFDLAAKEAQKWIDDIALYLFGFLIRRFREGIGAKGFREDEIWSGSFFNLGLNVIRQEGGSQTPPA